MYNFRLGLELGLGLGLGLVLGLGLGLARKKLPSAIIPLEIIH